MAADPQSKLNNLRKEIDAVDDRLVELFIQRLQLAKSIGNLKIELGQEIVDQEREALIIRRLQEKFGQQLSPEKIRNLFAEIIRISREAQSD